MTTSLPEEPEVPAALRLQPGQETLTPEQEAEATRFAQQRIAAHLSTEPVDEPLAEAWLRQAYSVAHLPPPTEVVWVDGPLALLAVQREALTARPGVHGDAIEVGHINTVESAVGETVGNRVRDTIHTAVRDTIETAVWDTVTYTLWNAIRAYVQAGWLAYYRFFDIYLAPNALRPLAHVNELVPTYWLGPDRAVLVRKPHLLTRDHDGRLHNPTGPCLQYPVAGASSPGMASACQNTSLSLPRRCIGTTSWANATSRCGGSFRNAGASTLCLNWAG